VVLNYKQLV